MAHSAVLALLVLAAHVHSKDTHLDTLVELVVGEDVVEADQLPEAEVLRALPEDTFCRKETDCQLISSRIAARAKRQDQDECEKRVALDTFGRRFDLCLRVKNFRDEDTFREHFGTINITLYEDGKKHRVVKLSSLTLTYMMGHVIGESFSAVNGFILDDKFYGSVHVDEHIFYVDPIRAANQSFSMFNDPNESGLPAAEFKRIQLEMQTYLKPAINAIISRYRTAFVETQPRGRIQQHLSKFGRSGIRRRRRSTPAPSRRVCDVAIVIDHLYFRDVGKSDLARALVQIFWILKEANSVLNAKDFDEDGKSEMLSISLSGITVLSSSDADINILNGHYDTPEDYLKAFSRYNLSSSCLGLLFTNRVFSDLVLGLSWRGNPLPGGVGGICQGLARYKADAKTYSFNALFVSMASEQQSRIPLRMAVLNLVHELLHAFGARHDPTAATNPLCTPIDAQLNGRFLMSRFSNNGRRLNHEELSVCTKQAVLDVLEAKHRTACLRTVNSSYCGDGVVQTGEECDCGTPYSCLKRKSSCWPNTGGGNQSEGCTTRKHVLSHEVAEKAKLPAGEEDDDEEAKVKHVVNTFERIMQEKYGVQANVLAKKSKDRR